MSHVTHVDESCPPRTRVMSHTRMSHVTHTNESGLKSHVAGGTGAPQSQKSEELDSPMAFISRTGLLLSHEHTSPTALHSRTRLSLSAILSRTPCVTGGSGAPQSQKSHEHDGESLSTHTKVCMMRCSVLQCVAVCCSMLQCVAVCCRELQ